MSSLVPLRAEPAQRGAKVKERADSLVTILHLAADADADTDTDADADADADAGQPVGDINGAQWVSPTSTALVNHRQQKGRSMSGLFK